MYRTRAVCILFTHFLKSKNIFSRVFLLEILALCMVSIQVVQRYEGSIFMFLLITEFFVLKLVPAEISITQLLWQGKGEWLFGWVWQSGLVPPNVPKKDKMPQMKNKKQAAALSAWEMLCVKAVGMGEGRAGESVPPVNFGQNRCKTSFRVERKLEFFFMKKLKKFVIFDPKKNFFIGLGWISEKPVKVVKIVFCCVVAYIQPDFLCCQQDFLVVWRWNQLGTFLGIFERL